MNQTQTKVNAQGKDLYDFDSAQAVVRLDKILDNDNQGYITYSKTLPLEHLDTSITVSVQVNEKENYHTVELVTWGSKSLDNGRLGNRMPIFAFCDDWNIHKDTQAIYAHGTGLKAALQDLETKFNGVKGRISITGTGDAAKGEAVITIKKKK